MTHGPGRRWPVLPAPFGLPVGAALLLCVGAAAAAMDGRMGGTAVAGCCAAVVVIVGSSSTASTSVALGVVGWMTAASFARPPYGDLHPAPAQALLATVLMTAAVVLAASVCFARIVHTDQRRRTTMETVVDMARFAGAVDLRRRVAGLALAAVVLPVLTVLLTGHPLHLSLADDLLIYLTAVVAVAVVGGLWPAVAAAVSASLLLNWFFTQPYHTLTIARADNLLSLLLFVVVAMSVSSVVHLSASRAQQAARSRDQAQALAALARTVLGEDDTPAAVLSHVGRTLQVGVELLERSGGKWARVAAAGRLDLTPRRDLRVRPDLRLRTFGPVPSDAHPLLEAGAGLAVAALDRDRLRTQAAQAEALAAGNRMRTALLAAVSHDLRTPLASIKASVSSLRQTDVEWSAQDRDALLENVEEGTDRLDELIANLLDMSRVQTGALQPYLRPAAVDEVVPLAVNGVPSGRRVRLDVPETLPLISTDAGLLERALANLVSNALRYSPADRPPEVVAVADGDVVRISVVDHGVGVPAEGRERMFEPFQRLGDQDAGTGVGLGLAVARGFVEAVAGRLEAADTPGGGLTMTVTLPTASASASATERVTS